MLISRTSIKILLLLIMAICYQITTNNNTSLYLQPIYAALHENDTSSGSHSKPQSTPDNRSNLLEQIRTGVKLKNYNEAQKAREAKNKDKPLPQKQQDPKHDVASILKRRVAMEVSDTESEGGDNSEHSGWDDEDEQKPKPNDTQDNQDHPSQNNYNTNLNNDDVPEYNGSQVNENFSGDTTYPESSTSCNNNTAQPVNSSKSHTDYTSNAVPPPPPPLPLSSSLQFDGNTAVSSASPVSVEQLPPLEQNRKNKSLIKKSKNMMKKIGNKLKRTRRNTSNNVSGNPVSTDNTESLPPPPPPTQEELDLDITNALAGATPEPESDPQPPAEERYQQVAVPPPPHPPLPKDPVTQTEDNENCDDDLPPPPPEEELANARAESIPSSQPSDKEADQQGAVPPPPQPLTKDQATQTEDDENYDNTSWPAPPPEEDQQGAAPLPPPLPLTKGQATQHHNTSGAIIHYTSIPMKVVNSFISRKIVNNISSSNGRYIGASESNSILRRKKYELECKYLYNATTIPKKNALGKTSIIGAIINLKYQFSNKLTAGVFYAPTVITYTMHNKGNNNTIAATTKDNIISHCIGMYTSYAIRPATYLSNQVSVGFSTAKDQTRDKNNSRKYGNPHYFIVDSFVSHKAKIDDTKTISPFLGLSYHSTNPRLYHNVGNINNLSLVMGVKLQYEYKYKDLVFDPWLKLTHTRSLYSNISAKIQDRSIIAQGEHLIDLLRDFHVAFNPNSSVTLALSVRRRDLRFAAGYEYSIHHECDNSYSHTFFARINIAF